MINTETASQNGASHRSSLHLEATDGQVLPLRLRAQSPRTRLSSNMLLGMFHFVNSWAKKPNQQERERENNFITPNFNSHPSKIRPKQISYSHSSDTWFSRWLDFASRYCRFILIRVFVVKRAIIFLSEKLSRFLSQFCCSFTLSTHTATYPKIVHLFACSRRKEDQISSILTLRRCALVLQRMRSTGWQRLHVLPTSRTQLL